MRPEYFEAIIERLQAEYSLSVDRSEHESIVEFYEGPLPLFKLIVTTPPERTGPTLLISYHIELDAPSAIQWFLRVRHLDPNLMISESYLKDSKGVSYVGEDADILKMYMVEQDVVAAYMQSEKDAEDILEQELPSHQPSPIKVYSEYKKALAEFNRMEKKKGEISH